MRRIMRTGIIRSTRRKRVARVLFTRPRRLNYGLGGALRAPLGPVAAPLVPRCALLPAPTPRLIGRERTSYPERVPSGVDDRQPSERYARSTRGSRGAWLGAASPASVVSACR